MGPDVSTDVQVAVVPDFIHRVPKVMLLVVFLAAGIVRVVSSVRARDCNAAPISVPGIPGHADRCYSVQGNVAQRAVRDCALTFSVRSLLISSFSAILRSRARPSLMASTKASNSYRVGSRRAAAGAVLYKGSRAMPRVSPSRHGHTGGSSSPEAITFFSGAAAIEVGNPRVTSPCSAGNAYFTPCRRILRELRDSVFLASPGHARAEPAEDA